MWKSRKVCVPSETTTKKALWLIILNLWIIIWPMSKSHTEEEIFTISFCDATFSGFALWRLHCLMFVKSLHIFFYVNSHVSKNCGRCTPYRCLFIVIYWHCYLLTPRCDALWSCVYSPDLFIVLLLHLVFFGHFLFVQFVVMGHFCNLF